MSLRWLFGPTKKKENENPEVKKLIKALKNKDWTECETAARNLGKIGDARAVQSLIDVIQNAIRDRGFVQAFAGLATSPRQQALYRLKQEMDRNKSMFAACGAAAEALARIGDPRAIKPLVDFLTFDQRAPEVATSLVAFGEPAVAQLSATLKSADPFDRMRHQSTAAVLGRIGGPQAMDVLIGALKDSDLLVREAAAKALGQCGEARATEPLMALLKDESSKVHNAAAQSLEKLNIPSAQEPIVRKKRAMKTPKFVEKRRTPSGTYEVYRGSDAESARDFLKSKTVNEKQYYIKVETSTGNWGKDIDGLYLERLVPFQLEINSAQCEGSICGMPTPAGLQYAANRIADNFVVQVKCGKCGHKWEDGIGYKNMTVVRCPSCNSLNKVDSGPHITGMPGLLGFKIEI
jgi:ribosomal protein S27E